MEGRLMKAKIGVTLQFNVEWTDRSMSRDDIKDAMTIALEELTFSGDDEYTAYADLGPVSMKIDRDETFIHLQS